jgi:thiol-disulfide isomerase/thioredoxin
MLNRRCLLSTLLLPAAVGSGLLAAGPASARSSGLEFTGIDGWLNTDAPPTLAGLRGKPVLVEFCTYTCINWRRTLPYMKRWQSEYGPQGLQIIGVHTPEFTFERTRPYVDRVLHDLGVTYPIAQDNEYRTWRAWDNVAWPAFYLLDRQGRVRLLREGEGHSAEIEDAIQALLGLARSGSSGVASEDADLSRIGTPEFYFGSLHGTPQDRGQSPRNGEATYAIAHPAGPRLNEYDLQGTWTRGDEPLVLRSDTGRVRVRFSAAKLHLIASAPEPAPVRVRLDRGLERTIQIGLPTLYTLVDGYKYGDHLLELECATPGLTVYCATFG